VAADTEHLRVTGGGQATPDGKARSAANIEAYKWQPGQSGNPSGLSSAQRRRFDSVQKLLDKEQSPEKVAEVIEKLRLMALDGHVPAAGLYLDRVIGPVKRETEEEPNLKDAPVEVLEWLSKQGRN
jgi:hypothetical protein